MAQRSPNALLVRYEGGHVYVARNGVGVRSEQYVEMRGFRDRDHAISVAQQILTNRRDPTLRITESGPVRSTFQIPQHAYRLGDRIDGEIVTSLSITQDSRGNLTVLPETANAFETMGAALDRRLSRAAAGVTGEYAAPVVDRQSTGSSVDSQPPEWSQSTVEPSISPAWTVTRPFWLSWFEVEIETAGAGTTRVAIFRQLKGSAVWEQLATASVSAADTRKVVKVNTGFPVGSKMRMATLAAGSGAENLTASPRGAMV